MSETPYKYDKTERVYITDANDKELGFFEKNTVGETEHDWYFYAYFSYWHEQRFLLISTKFDELNGRGEKQKERNKHDNDPNRTRIHCGCC